MRTALYTLLLPTEKLYIRNSTFIYLVFETLIQPRERILYIQGFVYFHFHTKQLVFNICYPLETDS